MMIMMKKLLQFTLDLFEAEPAAPAAPPKVGEKPKRLLLMLSWFAFHVVA